MRVVASSPNTSMSPVATRAGASACCTSLTLNRRCPPGVRNDGSRPSSAQRRSVETDTPAIAAAPLNPTVASTGSLLTMHSTAPPPIVTHSDHDGIPGSGGWIYHHRPSRPDARLEYGFLRGGPHAP